MKKVTFFIINFPPIEPENNCKQNTRTKVRRIDNSKQLPRQTYATPKPADDPAFRFCTKVRQLRVSLKV